MQFIINDSINNDIDENQSYLNDTDVKMLNLNDAINKAKSMPIKLNGFILNRQALLR